MTENKNLSEWRIIGETVPGASHLRAGTPNQDSLLCVRESSRSLPIVLSLADGHGSAKCFRSDRGSRFAVKKSAYFLSEFLDERRGRFDSAEIESKKDFLAEEFVKRWRETVEADLKAEPFTEKEFENLEEKSGAQARKLVEDNPLLAYGTTSLTVAIEEEFVLYMQLGDGDILNISETGEVTKPLPEDARLLANETTSMCLPKAEKDFRFFLQKISAEQSPQIIFLSTDGYLNSFADEAGFFQAGTDILQMLAGEGGFDTVSDNLKAWLEEATRMGSGDDCTVSIIYRPNKIGKTEKTEKSDVQKMPQTEMLSAPENSSAITASSGARTAAHENNEDVTVTITIKKDKNKKSVASVQTNAEAQTDAEQTKPSK